MNYHSMRTLEVVGFFVMAGLMQGCDRTIHVIQLDQPPNSFAFDQSNHKGDVLSVTVTTHDPNRTVAWRVQADKHVSCRGFRVTAGELLDGFSQTVPELPREFVPIPGKEYHIEVLANFKPPAWPIGVVWVAE